MECGLIEQQLNEMEWELAPGIRIIQHQHFIKKQTKKQTINSKGYRAKCNPLLAKRAKFSQHILIISFLKNSIEYLAFHCGWKGRGRCIFCDTGGYEERIKCKSRDEVKPSRHFFSYV